MIAGNSVGNEGQACSVQFSFPPGSLRAGADLLRFVYFGVGVGFVLAFVPSPPGEDAEPIRQRLLDVDADSVLRGGLRGMRLDFRPRLDACEKSRDRHAVDSHVGVVGIAEQTDYCLAVR